MTHTAINLPQHARHRIGVSGLLWPGISTLLMLLVLLALGVWQVQRLAWKEAILERIAAAEAAPAVPLPAAPGPFQKVSATGRFLPGPVALYGVEVRDSVTGVPEMGWQHLVPFATGGRVILVDRGWVPENVAAPAPAGPVTIVGYARPAERPRMFGVAGDPARRQFFTLDPQPIAAALGLPPVAPFTLVALGPTRPGVFPAPAEHLPRPLNNHLAYAITWFGLAAALLVVFTVWARKRLSA